MWHFRRDDRISRPVSEVTTLSGSGLPIVRPEVQLLYMAKSAEAKSQHDFDIARPRLEHDAAFWLAEALATTLPGHRPLLCAARYVSSDEDQRDVVHRPADA